MESEMQAMSEQPEIARGAEAERRLRTLTIRQALGWLAGAAGGSVFVAWCASPNWVLAAWPVPVTLGLLFGCLIVFPLFMLFARLGRSLVWVYGGCIILPAMWAALAVWILPSPALGAFIAISVFAGFAVLLGVWDPPRVGWGARRAV